MKIDELLAAHPWTDAAKVRADVAAVQARHPATDPARIEESYCQGFVEAVAMLQSAPARGIDYSEIYSRRRSTR